MRFFVPQAARSQQEALYQAIILAVVDQFHWKITPRRIFALEFQRGKLTHRLEVGKREHQENMYEVLAIFESNTYVAYTRLPNGSHGVTILVNKEEVVKVEEFDFDPKLVVAEPLAQ